MIASFSRNFIFIKTRKTGGTSAEILLSAWCSSRDIVSTISGVDELTRQQYGGTARNFSEKADVIDQFNFLVRNGDAAAIQQYRKSHRADEKYYNHMPAREVREMLPELWRTSYKFTIERHPYERAVSAAWWQARNTAAPDISSEIDRAIETKIFCNYPLYTADGAPIVDEIIPYDSMWVRLRELAGEFGCPPIVEMPAAKSSHRLVRSPARDVLSPGQKKRIQEVARLEFELCGFEP